MKICEEHWGSLREAVEERGLGAWIAEDVHEVAEQMMRVAKAGHMTLRSFEPLLSANFAIFNNATRIIEEGGGDPLYLMSAGPEEPVRLEGAEGRTWPRCPICYLSLAHELTCPPDNPHCRLDHVDGYDWMIAKAADEQVDVLQELRAEAAKR